MTTKLRTTDALVIGGGMTGAGVLRDLAMRGIRAVLVERGDAASGTTGRYHGLLHSGGRYAVKDPVSARDCARENAILRRIIPQCIEDTGGYFVVTPWDPPDYADTFVAACREQGVPCEEVPVREALRREPRLNPRIARAFAVPDAAADSFLSVATNLRSAREHGAEVLTYHRVASLIMEGGRVAGAWVVDRRTGEERAIEAGVVVNAAGAWAGQIGALAGVEITIVPGRGVMVALNHRLVNTVVNRCQPPADGDILVPIRTVCVIGTTDRHVEDPDDTTMPADEVAFMLAEGDKLVPGLATSRALRAWAGSRPLYKETGSTVANRDLSRDYKLLDHEVRDGVAGFISIVGGKYTTYRLMAERTVDLAARRLGVAAPCRTADEAVGAWSVGPGAWSMASRRGSRWPFLSRTRRRAADAPHSPLGTPRPTTHALRSTLDAPRSTLLGAPLAAVEEADRYGQLICECELVTRERVDAAIAGGVANLDDLRRDLRLGMGPCQGGFCTYRAAALVQEAHAADAEATAAANLALRDFLEERWRGLTPVLWGDQARQERLDELIYLGVLAVDRLPTADAAGDWLVPAALTPRPPLPMLGEGGTPRQRGGALPE